MIGRFDPKHTVLRTKVVQRPGYPPTLLRTMSSGEILVEELIPVNAGKPLCFRCLSHDVTLHVLNNGLPQLVCHECGVRYSPNEVKEEERT